ncbi:hypothetical protein [Microbacterium murale]|uniref:DUF4190 domain-containing protein n=1 Tax=Microbacterium murale TaxID=1081040 RepID=A0ABQ1RFD5_9MICO|nr:hypothetical protein [Microbacterium murale]GGD64883.1 hypothetical protein GCM10007269_05110 [Microbacterium murale]
MSDPQQSPVPPYAQSAGQPPQPAYPPQPTTSGAPAPSAQHYYQGGAQPPQYSQPQYAQPQYGQPAYASAASGRADTNTPGRIGFIVGLVGLAFSLLTNVIIQIMIRSAGYQLIGLVSGALSVITFLAALTALILGIIGLRRAGEPHGLAGIATGLGGAGVVGAGFSFILNAVSSFLYF